MHRATLLLAAAMLIPLPATAIDLHWASGSTQLSHAGAALCTLVVQASPQERRLPLEWRLLWVSKGGDIRFAAFDSGSDGVAGVTALRGPLSSTDSLSHLQTAAL